MQQTAYLRLLLVLCTAASCQADPAKPKLTPMEAAADTIAPPAAEVSVDTMPAEILPSTNDESPAVEMASPPDRLEAGTPAPPQQRAATGLPPEFSDVTALDPTIRLDIRYATTDNFTKKKIYDCPRCLLRPAVAQALVKAHRALQAKGYGLMVYDCYRPRPYQQRLWDAVPDPNYVTPPARGSMHSRGAAVDLTVVDASGRELDMGTPYDFFGRAAHTDHTDLPARVLANRRLLDDAMRAAGFEGIRTEWWHYSFRGKRFELASYVWPCE